MTLIAVRAADEATTAHTATKNKGRHSIVPEPARCKLDRYAP